MTAAEKADNTKPAASLYTTEGFMRKYLADHTERGELITSDEYATLVDMKQYDVREYYNQFYNKDANGYPTSYNPSRIAEHIIDNVPYFILEDGTFFVYKNGVYKPDTKQTTIKLIIENHIKPDDRRRNKTAEVLELLRNQPSKERGFESVNLQPKHFICFKNGMYDLINRRMVDHSPSHYCINQIPREYDPAAVPTKGEKINSYLRQICPAEDDRKMLLTFAGYCLTCDNGLQKFLMLYGQPGTGKSTLIDLLTEIIGEENVSDRSLADICGDRFAAYGMTGKLCNFSADLKASAIEDPAIFKMITGGDRITVQRKGVDGFDTKIYARLMFSANELPAIQTKDDAFFRRTWVLHINKPPKEVNPRLLEELKAEADYFLHLCVESAENLYKMSNAEIATLESVESVKMRQYWQQKGDTVAAFLYDSKPFSESTRVRATDLRREYEAYCEEEERTPLKKHNFYRSLREKGITETIVDGYPCFVCQNEKYRVKKDFTAAGTDNPFNT